MLIYLIKMLFILVLCPTLLATPVQTLSIDSQLGTSIEDCFDRISIGEQLPNTAIYRNVSELTTRECEQICKQDKQCQTYDYGVGAKGNASCDLSNLNEKELKEKKLLSRHPDYDVYVRRIQCEQSPPTPLQPQFDDPGEGGGPLHRPVIRPEAEEPKRPLADDFPPPIDLRPFETTRPDLRPYPHYKPPYTNHLDDRPDDYYNQKPDFDRPPSYGFHKPQDIPFRPEKPNKKPDPYDVIQFQEHYGRPPPEPGLWRPDPYHPPLLNDDISDIYGPKPTRPRPDLPPYVHDEKPQYHYITRPNKKPPPPILQEGIGYGNRPSKPQDYPKPGYGQNDPGHPVGPIGPPNRPYRPSRPQFDQPYKPSYDYHGQYASNYGQNQYQDNSIYLEIYDPPRPFKPLNDKPMIGPSQGTYGQNYGYGSPGSYGYGGTYQSQNSHSHYFGTITQLDDQNQNIYNRPQDGIGHRPQKPAYNTQSSYGGSSQSSQEFDQSFGTQSSSYRPQTTPKPQDSYSKPAYGSSQGYGNQGSYDSTQGSYGSTQSNQASYGSDIQSSFETSNRPSYGSNQEDDIPQSSYGGSNRPLNHNRPSYGNNRPYNNNRPMYGNNKPSNSPADLPSYNKPSYSEIRPPYGNKPQLNDDSPSYGSNKPSYDYSQLLSVGNRPSNENFQSSYGGDRPSNDHDRPTYDNNRPSYVDNGPSYDNNRPDADYGPPYDGNGPSYGSNQAKPPVYGQSSPNSAYGNQGSTDGYKNTGYGNQKPTKPNKTDGYNQNWPVVKPVYEFEKDRPNNVPSYIVRPSGEVITSRPVAIGDYERPGYGREPGLQISYKLCFRRVLAGRRALRSHVRKVVPCERLEDCRRECATERRFHCESFNYRLDPSYRGKGLCELMTKPIEAFDLRRDFVDDKDYDFYELDRNSLEPYCPETLRGPGMLHSGFLSSKSNRMPEYQGWGRGDGYDSRYYQNTNGYYDGGDSNFGRRRYEDKFFVPYQIGVGRSNDDQENWGQYGGYYGGYDTYYKNRNDYHKSINHWRLNDMDPKPHRPSPDFNYYDLGKRDGWDGYVKDNSYGYGSWKRGRWNSSGVGWNGLDYAESNYYKKPNYYEPAERRDEPIVKDCSSRRRPGMSLGSGAIRRSLIARNVVECEAACFGEREFKCVSYSYRYSNSRGSDNCFLSERPYRGLELSEDSGSDVYAMPQDHGCSAVTPKPWVESECFWHVRSGAAVSGSAFRAALTVAGLGACEAECIRAHAFFCRGFSFRYDSPTIGDDLENCILTSSPPTSLDSGRGLRPTTGHELYSRGNYGRGCEPALYDDVHHKETECYLQYDNAAKLIGTAVKGQARVRDEQACGVACTDAPFRCLSFSFNTKVPSDTDNCLLSEIRLFDLQRGVDYEHSADDWLFAFDLFNGQCWRKVHGKGEYDQPAPELPRPLSRPPPEETYPASGPSGPSGPPGYPAAPPEPSYIPGSGPPSGASYKPYPEKPGYSPGFRPSYPPGYVPERPIDRNPPGYLPRPVYGEPRPSGGFKPGYLPETPYKPEYSEPSGPGYRPEYQPDYPSGPSGPGYKPGYPVEPRPEPGYEPGRLPVDRPPGNRGEEPIAVSWRHFTVSGFPCRKGTSCAQNQVAGHWACEPEGGEVGSWDYCCSPNHRCGYSEGFHKPWCYVGPSQDQWRPCSEKYYPYHQHNTPHPTQGHQGHRDDGRRPPSRPWQERPRPPDTYNPDDRNRPDPGPYLSEADRKYWDDLYNNGPRAYYDKFGNPLPGYTRVPTADRPYIRYHHNYPRPGGGHFVPISPELDPPVPGGFGAPRYWPVAYLHKGPPPNVTYFRYNETDRNPTSTTEHNPPRPSMMPPRDRPPPQFTKVNPDRPNGNNIDNRNHRDEKTRNMTNANEDTFSIDLNKLKTTTTTATPEVKETETEKIKEKDIKINDSAIEAIKPQNVKVDKVNDNLKGIDGKIDDFTSSIEVLDLEDAKIGDKPADLKTLEAEERQIEAIGRLVASRRGGQLVLEKRSQKDIESKSIALDNDLVNFNFGNRFPTTERRGIIQKVTKDEIVKERNTDRSLEVSETTFVRPPRVLSTTESIRKLNINGKVFYDATIREQRDIYSNNTRKAKSLRPLEERAPSIIANTSYGKKKIIRARNVNPVRKVRRVYRRKYNPEEVRRRLLERERSMKQEITAESSRKL